MNRGRLARRVLDAAEGFRREGLSEYCLFHDTFFQAAQGLIDALWDAAKIAPDEEAESIRKACVDLRRGLDDAARFGGGGRPEMTMDKAIMKAKQCAAMVDKW